MLRKFAYIISEPCDLVNCFWHFFESPNPGAVYNMGGSRHSNCSMLEAIQMAETMSGKKLDFTLENDNRIGDHIWWISDVRAFQKDYPGWSYKFDIETIMQQIVDATVERYG